MNLKARLEQLEKRMGGGDGETDAQKMARARKFEHDLWRAYGEPGEVEPVMSDAEALAYWDHSDEFEAALDRIFAGDETEDENGN